MRLMDAFETQAARKWGDAGLAFQAVPDLLFKKQAALGLSPTDMLVILNITMFWWYADRKPFPSIANIANRLGVEPRTVQRSLKKLTDKGFIKRMKELVDSESGKERQVFDLSGLVEQLRILAKDDPDIEYRKQLRTGQRSRSAEDMLA